MAGSSASCFTPIFWAWEPRMAIMTDSRMQGQKRLRLLLSPPRPHCLPKLAGEGPAERPRGTARRHQSSGPLSRSGGGQGRSTENGSLHTHPACYPRQGQAEGGTHTQTPWQLSWASSPTGLQRDPLLPSASCLLCSPWAQLAGATLSSG